jgi:hypothetical protein
VRNELWKSLSERRKWKEVACDPQGDDGSGFSLDRVPDRYRERIDVGGVLGKLSVVDRALIRSHFGINGEPLGLVAAGNRFGLSRTQARRVIDAVLSQLWELVDPDGMG